MTLTRRIEQAARISAATCAYEGSPANNYTVIMDLKMTVYTLALELQGLARDIQSGEAVSPERLALLGSLAETWEAARHRQQEAASNG